MSVKWRVERVGDAVKFWIGNQGFEIYRRDKSSTDEEHKGLMHFYVAQITHALTKLSPQ